MRLQMVEDLVILPNGDALVAFREDEFHNENPSSPGK